MFPLPDADGNWGLDWGGDCLGHSFSLLAVPGYACVNAYKRRTERQVSEAKQPFVLERYWDTPLPRPAGFSCLNVGPLRQLTHLAVPTSTQLRRRYAERTLTSAHFILFPDFIPIVLSRG